MTCCPIGRHPDVDAIDRAIRAQQAASRANESTRAPSYSQIARTYGVRKATLLAHRDECMAQRTGTADGGVPVRPDGVPGRTVGGGVDENANDSARSDRYAASVPSQVDAGVDAQSGRSTGPPGVGTDRRSVSRQDVPGAAQSDTDRVAHRDAAVVVDEGHGAPSAERADAESHDRSERRGVGQARPPEPSLRQPIARARDPVQAEKSQKYWSQVRATSETFAVRQLANTLDDASDARGDASSNFRAHGSYIHEIACIIDDGAWRNTKTVNELVARWKIDRLRVLQYFRDASLLVRVSRGDIAQERENSLARWAKLFDRALESEAAGARDALKVAADALKGYDAAAGIVDRSTRVQVNVMQDPQAQAFLGDVWETLRAFPDAAAALRARLASKRDAYGELPPVEVVDAAE